MTSPLGLSPEQSELTSQIEINDSDVLKIEPVLQVLNSRQGKRTDLESFRKEIMERFGAIGFGVDVKVFEAETHGHEMIYVFKIEIQKRLSGQFDPDQQVAEVTKDILDLGTGGVISTSGLWVPPGSRKI